MNVDTQVLCECVMFSSLIITQDVLGHRVALFNLPEQLPDCSHYYFFKCMCAFFKVRPKEGRDSPQFTHKVKKRPEPDPKSLTPGQCPSRYTTPSLGPVASPVGSAELPALPHSTPSSACFPSPSTPNSRTSFHTKVQMTLKPCPRASALQQESSLEKKN